MSKSEWRALGLLPHDVTIAKRFGTWSKAIAAAGLEVQTGQSKAATRSEKQNRDRNRQMVTARPQYDSMPGTVKHYQVGGKT